MKPGLVLAIEPMINLGKKEITQLDVDGLSKQKIIFPLHILSTT